MADKVVSAIIRALRPQFQELVMELKAINARLDATNARPTAMDATTDAFRNEFRSEIKRLDDKMDAFKNELI